MATKKGGRGRKALTAVLDNDANISAGKAAAVSPQKSKSKAAAEAAPFADELLELQGRLEQLRLEKEQAEAMVKERDEVIREKEEEIETRGKEQERLQAEVKKLQRMKEFNPTVSMPLVKSLIEKDHEGDEKGKKKKKGKNGHERKKPCPAYILWCKDQWNEIKKETPDADFKEVANMLGARWKALSAEEKQPYDERYRQEKEAYLRVVGQEKREAEAMKLLEEEQMKITAKELLEQYLLFRQESEGGAKKAKKVKDPLRPKQPMSAFFLYSQERRAVSTAEKKNIPELAKIAGEEWKNMTEAQKAPYEEVAKKQKEEYHKQMEVYKQKKLEEAASLENEEEELRKILRQEALQLLKKKEKTENIIKKTKETRQKNVEKAVDPNRPKKPASSFLLFSNEARRQFQQEHPGVDNTTVRAMLSVRWKELGDEERQVWNKKAAEAMAAYRREMEEYEKTKNAAS